MVIWMELIWGEERRWIRQAHRWWTDNQWRDRGIELDTLCWKADWILMEESQVPKAENEFFKMDKGQVIYIAGKKSLPVTV